MTMTHSTWPPMIEDLVEELRAQGAGDGCEREIDVIETHISWVLLGPVAYKVKKPVAFPFLDFSTRARRAAACAAELAVNRRLAPRTYLDVVPIRRRPDGRFTLAGDDASEPVESAVRMVRLDESRSAAALLAAGALDARLVDRIAEGIASFHEDAPASARIAASATEAAIEKNVRDNFEALADAPGLVTSEELDALARWQLSFLRGHRDLLARRIRAGAIRDGHGDLRLEHVFFEGKENEDFEVIDAIEFDARYRWADVAADIAFLSMDLARLGRVDLAERLLAVYARASNDFDLYSVIDFYESYRACVRAKIAARSAPDEARRYLLFALAATRRPVLPPVLVAVGGMIGAGKSTVAERIAARMSAPIVDADRTRKHMIGLRPTAHADDAAWSGAYDPRFSEEVYAEVLRRADAVLRSGRPVVVDASFRSAAARAQVRELASRNNVPFRFVECSAPLAVCRERLRQRDRGTAVSDGRAEVLDAFAARFERVTELSPPEHLTVDTTGSVEAAVSRVEQELPIWPERLVS
jgi:aminoglycoside phosphotransferase family enzyme/predicted kinase